MEKMPSETKTNKPTSDGLGKKHTSTMQHKLMMKNNLCGNLRALCDG